MATIDEVVKTNFQNDKHRFMANLVFTSSWMQNMFTQFLKPYDLSSQQFNILRILRGAGDWMTMNAIKDVMIEKAPNATRLSDKLLAKELIIRKRSDEDRRVVYLNITGKGLELLKVIDQNQSPQFEEFMSKITEEKAKEISDLFDTMRG